jgi:hypothetical protein
VESDVNSEGCTCFFANLCHMKWINGLSENKVIIRKSALRSLRLPFCEYMGVPHFQTHPDGKLVKLNA